MIIENQAPISNKGVMAAVLITGRYESSVILKGSCVSVAPFPFVLFSSHILYSLA